MRAHSLPALDERCRSRSLSASQLHRAARGAARLMAVAEQHRRAGASGPPLQLDSWVVDEDARQAHVTETGSQDVAGQRPVSK